MSVKIPETFRGATYCDSEIFKSGYALIQRATFGRAGVYGGYRQTI